MGAASSRDLRDGDLPPLSLFDPAPSQRLRDSATRRRTVYRAQPFPVPADFADRVCISVNAKRSLRLVDPDHTAARSMDFNFSFVRHEHREDGVVRDAWYEVHPLCDPRARLGRLTGGGFATLLDETQCASNELRQKGLSFRFRLRLVDPSALSQDLRHELRRGRSSREVWFLQSIDDGEPLRFGFSLAYQRSESRLEQYLCSKADQLLLLGVPERMPSFRSSSDDLFAQSVCDDYVVGAAKGPRNYLLDVTALLTLQLQHGNHALDAEEAAKLHDIRLPEAVNTGDFESHNALREAAAARDAFCNRALVAFLSRGTAFLPASSVAGDSGRSSFTDATQRLKIRETLTEALGTYLKSHLAQATGDVATADLDPASPTFDGPATFEHLPTTPRVSVMVSGGGWRALVGAVHFFEALDDVELMPLVHSVVGLSGGAWAIILALMSPSNAVRDHLAAASAGTTSSTRAATKHADPATPTSTATPTAPDLTSVMSEAHVAAATARVADALEHMDVSDTILRVAKGAVAATVTSLGSWVSKSLTNSSGLLKAIASNSERTMLFNFAELLHQQFLAGVDRRAPLADAGAHGPGVPLAFAAVNSKTYREPSGKGNYGHPHLWHVFDNVGGGGTQFLGAPRIPLDRIELVHHFVEQQEPASPVSVDYEAADSPRSLFAGEPITPCSLMAMCGSAGASWSEVVKAFDGEGFVGKLHVHDTPLREAKGSGRHYTHLQDAGIDCNLPFPVVTEGVGGVGPSDVVLCLDSCLCGRVPTELTKGMAKRYWRGAFSDTSRGVTTAFAPGEVRVFFPAPGSGHPVLVYGFGDTESATMQMDRTREEIEACRRQVFATTQRMNQALQWVLTLGQRDVPAKGYAAFSDEKSPSPRSLASSARSASAPLKDSFVALEQAAREAVAMTGRFHTTIDRSGGLDEFIIGAGTPQHRPRGSLAVDVLSDDGIMAFDFDFGTSPRHGFAHMSNGNNATGAQTSQHQTDSAVASINTRATGVTSPFELPWGLVELESPLLTPNPHRATVLAAAAAAAAGDEFPPPAMP